MALYIDIGGVARRCTPRSAMNIDVRSARIAVYTHFSGAAEEAKFISADCLPASNETDMCR